MKNLFEINEKSVGLIHLKNLSNLLVLAILLTQFFSPSQVWTFDRSIRQGKPNLSSWGSFAVVGLGDVVAKVTNLSTFPEVGFFDVSSGQLVRTFKFTISVDDGEAKYIRLASSDDGGVLLVSFKHSGQPAILALNSSTGEVIQTTKYDSDSPLCYNGYFDSLAVSPDGLRSEPQCFSPENGEIDYTGADQIQFLDDHRILANRCGADDGCLWLGPHSDAGIYDYTTHAWQLALSYPDASQTKTSYMSRFSINAGLLVNWNYPNQTIKVESQERQTENAPLIIFDNNLREVRRYNLVGGFNFVAVSPRSDSFSTIDASGSLKIWRVTDQNAPTQSVLNDVANVQYAPLGDKIFALSTNKTILYMLEPTSETLISKTILSK